MRRLEHDTLRARSRGARLLPQITALWLLAVWFLLWGKVSPGLAASGIVVTFLVVRAFPLEPLPLDGRLSPLPALWLALHFGWDLVRASTQVSWLTIRPGAPPPSAVIAVRLRTRSDLLLTLTAECVVLVPGSLVVEIDRTETTLYIHVFGIHDTDEVERERRSVWALEARLIRAFGSPEDRALLDAAEAGDGPPAPPDAVPGPADVAPATDGAAPSEEGDAR
ncbi:MAG: Na+/H+ antiporter subunit E [Solirubrobacteraceae bacterium]|nr:Na+/H+ antiporter subunit E [Solirubrobacteraceae bacterium]